MRVRNSERERNRECERRVEMAPAVSDSARECDRAEDPALDRSRPGVGNATVHEASACVALRPCTGAGF